MPRSDDNDREMPASLPPSRRHQSPRAASELGAPGTRHPTAQTSCRFSSFSKLLSPDQVEPIRRTARTKSVSVEQAIVDLGLLSEVQIAESLARHAGLRFVKINPLDLDLDVVTTALSGPFARRHGLIAISKNATTLTVAVHDPLAPFPSDDIRRVTGLDVERVVATRSDVDALNRAFYGLKTSLKTRGEAAGVELAVASIWATRNFSPPNRKS